MTGILQFIFFSVLIFFRVAQIQGSNFSKDILENSHGKIFFASVVFRHGARTPTKLYPTDPYDPSYWPEGFGQLTKQGKLQEYELGKWLRSRYDSLIDRPYRYDVLKLNSSDMDRTIMSAQCLLAGFYPPTADEMWSGDGLKWQPIPVHSISSAVDNVIGFKAPCDKYYLEQDLVNSSPEMEAYFKEHESLFEYVSQHSGLEMSSKDVLDAVDKLWDVYDNLFIEDSQNLTLPSWTKNIYPQPLKKVAEPSFSFLAYSYEMRRLRGGPLIQDIVNDMQLKIKGTMNDTFHFYSGHDTTVSALLTSLDMYNGIAPPYSTAVLFELREKDGDFVVTISYRNSSTELPYLLHLPGCPYVCTLDDFIRLTAHLIPQNWEEECSVGYVNILSYRSVFELTVMVAVIILLGLLLLSIIRLHIIRRKRYSHYEVIRNSVLNLKDGLE